MGIYGLETDAFAARYAAGVGWGELKQVLKAIRQEVGIRPPV